MVVTAWLVHLELALFFCTLFSPWRFTFFRAHSHNWQMPRDVTNIHEDWAGFYQCQKCWGHFSCLVLEVKLKLPLAIGRWGHPQPLEIPSQNQKDHRSLSSKIFEWNMKYFWYVAFGKGMDKNKCQGQNQHWYPTPKIEHKRVGKFSLLLSRF